MKWSQEIPKYTQSTLFTSSNYLQDVHSILKNDRYSDNDSITVGSSINNHSSEKDTVTLSETSGNVGGLGDFTKGTYDLGLKKSLLEGVGRKGHYKENVGRRMEPSCPVQEGQTSCAECSEGVIGR